ncbi:nitrogenase iron-molybdenum cofactor biosynthesis protein NifN [Vibrio sp. WXL210]|uniref:nitrogenase iron-molybdenum cofactor biosynthesis protein NifN n=1 Tax=Vibrio sp. WXL210 TaxID=3450709 RepID=UPI003EC57693
MTIIRTQNSALSTKPLKTSAATGAALASMGFDHTIPLIHGSQGCSAFSKVYLISHFREPFPIQNTAVDQVAAVMGTEENLQIALENLCRHKDVECITVLTSGLVEMQGCDIWLAIKNFKVAHPEWSEIKIVPVSTPDFKGTMETGFAKLVESVVKQYANPTPTYSDSRQVNVLCSVYTTTADIDLLARYLEAFELTPIFLPDLSLSLDGHLESEDYSPTSTGGTKLSQVEQVSSSGLTLVLGESCLATARWLEARFAIPYLSIDMGFVGTDEWVTQLAEYTQKTVPTWIERARQRAQDAMLDTHFVLSDTPVAIVAEPDLAYGYSQLLGELGVNRRMIVTTYAATWCEQPALPVVVGDMSQLDTCLDQLDLVLGNSHLEPFVQGQAPLVKIGYPCFNQFGNTDILQLGYEGVRAQAFRLANTLMSHHKQEVSPHVSAYHFTPSEVSHVEA